MLFLTAKLTCAIAGYLARCVEPSTTTWRRQATRPAAMVDVRELHGGQHHAQLVE
jgi:hypothetical protein